ncbi:MAG: DUF6152 family protein [Pseudomonadota bacterium]
MSNHRFSVAALAALMLAAALPSDAHHSFSMYDMSKTVILRGEVVRYVWQAPHSHIFVKVAPEAGKPGSGGEYDIEGPAPNILSRQGWNKLSMKVGDAVTLVAHPLRANDKGGALVYAVKNGEIMYVDAKRPEIVTPGVSGDKPTH